MSILSSTGQTEAPRLMPPDAEPDYAQFITEDGQPVDSLYSERQHRLLTDALFASWTAPGGQPHLAATDVGLFYSVNEPAVVPDVMLSLGVSLPGDWSEKKNRSYFIWRMGKCPDLTVEVVSNAEGGELTTKKDRYAQIGIPYYVVWDPMKHLSEHPLQCFVLRGRKYEPCEPWFADLELGVMPWEGGYDGMQDRWLRFCDADGVVLPTGVERAEQAERRASTAETQARAAEKQRRDAEKQRQLAEQRAAKLAEKLRSLGVDPDEA